MDKIWKYHVGQWVRCEVIDRGSNHSIRYYQADYPFVRNETVQIIGLNRNTNHYSVKITPEMKVESWTVDRRYTHIDKIHQGSEAWDIPEEYILGLGRKKKCIICNIDK